mgnify:CR=1 FL=1
MGNAKSTPSEQYIFSPSEVYVILYENGVSNSTVINRSVNASTAVSSNTEVPAICSVVFKGTELGSAPDPTKLADRSVLGRVSWHRPDPTLGLRIEIGRLVGGRCWVGFLVGRSVGFTYAFFEFQLSQIFLRKNRRLLKSLNKLFWFFRSLWARIQLF